MLHSEEVLVSRTDAAHGRVPFFFRTQLWDYFFVSLMYKRCGDCKEIAVSSLTLPGHKKCNFRELTDQRNRAEGTFKPTLRNQTHTRDGAHSRGISPSDLFIHFLQRGNLTHEIIHLCDVAVTPSAPCDTSSIFGPQINTKAPEILDSCNTDKGSGAGRRSRRVADAKPGNLSFNLRLYIGHFKDRHILCARDPSVRKL